MTTASLTAGVKTMRDAAIQISSDDLHKLGDKTKAKLHVNPLQNTFECLRDVLLQRSMEAQKREARRAKWAREAKKARDAKEADVKESTTMNLPSTFQSPLSGTQPVLPETHKSSTLLNTFTPTKRKVSETSFGTSSMETTPSKLTSPEANIQELQNSLVRDVLKTLYDEAAAPVSWARNRNRMKIRYVSFVHPCMCN